MLSNKNVFTLYLVALSNHVIDSKSHTTASKTDFKKSPPYFFFLWQIKKEKRVYFVKPDLMKRFSTLLGHTNKDENAENNDNEDDDAYNSEMDSA